jgi:hypothetical protein
MSGMTPTTPNPTAVNPYVHAQRLTKAFKLAQFLRRYQITAEEAAVATREDWVTSAALAGVKWDPSHEHLETVALTIAKLRAMEEVGVDEG